MIPEVTIVVGTESPVGEGVNGAFRCLVRFPDETMTAAIVKRLSAEGLAAEVFCALLLSGWGLSIPRPAIILEPNLAFASIDCGYPNLKQRIGLTDQLSVDAKKAMITYGASLVSKFRETPTAMAADEAIENLDRNLGNILWDGLNTAWIDHERAFGLGDDADNNKLATMVLMSDADHNQIKGAAVAIALILSRDVVREAEIECGRIDASVFSERVTGRLGGLAARILNRFPEPQDLLSQLQPS